MTAPPLVTSEPRNLAILGLLIPCHQATLRHWLADWCSRLLPLLSVPFNELNFDLYLVQVSMTSFPDLITLLKMKVLFLLKQCPSLMWPDCGEPTRITDQFWEGSRLQSLEPYSVTHLVSTSQCSCFSTCIFIVRVCVSFFFIPLWFTLRGMHSASFDFTCCRVAITAVKWMSNKRRRKLYAFPTFFSSLFSDCSDPFWIPSITHHPPPTRPRLLCSILQWPGS